MFRPEKKGLAMALYYAFLLLVLTATSINAAVSRPVVTRGVSAHCEMHSPTNTVKITFTSRLNSDIITYIGGCQMNETTQTLYIVPCNFKTFTEGGSEHMQVETVIDLDNPTNRSYATNPCGYEATDVGNGVYNFKLTLVMRRKEGYIFYGDLDYSVSCKPSTAISTYLTAGVDVIYTPMTQEVDVQTPYISLAVFDMSMNAIDTCNTNEDIMLGLIMAHSVTYEDHMSPYGLMAYETNVGRSLEDLENRYRIRNLIGNDGCAAPNPFGLDGDGFVISMADSTPQTVVYFTSPFRCRRYRDTSQMWFSTRISTCSGQFANLFNAADKCSNFCQYSLANVRKRREAQGEDDVTDKDVYAVITVREEEEVLEKSEEGEGVMSKTVLIAISVSVTVLVVALLFIFGCFFWFTGNQKRAEKTRSGSYLDSSRASSNRKLPVKF